MGLKVLAAIAVAVLAGASPAMAAPGLANKVYEPYVKRGITEVELRGGRLTGGAAAGESKALVEVSHGFSDRVSAGLAAEFEDTPGARRRLAALALGTVVYIGQIPGTGVDVGGYLEYVQPVHGGASAVEAKLLFARQFGPVNATANLIAERPLSRRNHETEFEYALQGTVDAGGGWNLGAQVFGDLGTTKRFGGRQEHFLGPVARFETHPSWMPGELELEAAYLFAAGAAKDETNGQFRFVIEWENRF